MCRVCTHRPLGIYLGVMNACALIRIRITPRARRGFDEARVLLKAALRVRTTSLGPRHLDTADTMLKLGALEWEQGLSKEAEVLYR